MARPPEIQYLQGVLLSKSFLKKRQFEGEDWCSDLFCKHEMLLDLPPELMQLQQQLLAQKAHKLENKFSETNFLIFRKDIKEMINEFV